MIWNLKSQIKICKEITVNYEWENIHGISFDIFPMGSRICNSESYTLTYNYINYDILCTYSSFILIQIGIFNIFNCMNNNRI